MIFSKVLKRWEMNARLDPMWAILARPNKENRAWSEAEFFETGHRSLNSALLRVGVDFSETPFKRALDFGCGMGRITQNLCPLGKEVHGVDISKEMIRLAETHNRFARSCVYHHNPSPDLRLFPSDYFDFIYCVIVLQHMPPPMMKRYLREFLRVLAPGGKLLVQIPTNRLSASWVDRVKDLVRPVLPLPIADRLRSSRGTGVPVLEMYGLPSKDVRAIVEAGQGTLLRVEPDKHAGPGWESRTYLIQKSG